MASTDGAINSTDVIRSALGGHHRRREARRGAGTDCIRTGTLSRATRGLRPSAQRGSPGSDCLAARQLHSVYLQTPASLHAACRVACVLATSPLVTNNARASLYWVAQLSNAAAP